jgi:hypothetical protein
LIFGPFFLDGCSAFTQSAAIDSIGRFSIAWAGSGTVRMLRRPGSATGGGVKAQQPPLARL